MKLKELIIKLVLSSLLCMVAVAVSIAQPGNPSGDPDVPITGIEILLTLGGLIGIKRFLATKKNTK
ncbi:MAG: hypothetical protein KF856_13665 [Cyclobacteriaceae bacterium]|nr:hypothetical protein [Cyclobacteriaceae bacterium]